MEELSEHRDRYGDCGKEQSVFCREMAEKSSADASAPDASGRRYFGKKAKCQELKAEQQGNYETERRD